MTYNLQDLLPEDMTDETAYHLGSFLYDLARAFEYSHFRQIIRYNKVLEDFANEMRKQRS